MIQHLHTGVTPCVGDSASKFLADPSSEPYLTCAQSEAYKTQFVLP